MDFFLISSIILGLIDQLPDLLTVVSDRIAGAFNRFGATRAVQLIYLRLPIGFGMLVFFKDLLLMEFQVRYLPVFHLFSLIDPFLDGKSSQDIQLMLQFLKAAFLVLHSSYYSLMTLMMIFSVTLLSMLMILLCTLKCSSDL